MEFTHKTTKAGIHRLLWFLQVKDMRMKVHIFNPETDYALGCTGGNYIPPATVVRLRQSMSLFPATYAKPGDAILLLDKISEDELSESAYIDMARSKCLRVVSLGNGYNELLDIPDTSSERRIEIFPWGWNHTLRNLLLRHGFPAELLKSEEEIENIRTIAHRRTTIPFLKGISRLMPGLDIRIPKEFLNVEEALSFANDDPGCYFKMPWSSSGRGVICAAGMSQQKLTEWLRGAVARQGSVLGEHGYDRAADFATEWCCTDGNARFVGYSWFDTGSNGRYIGNQHLSQAEIKTKIKEVASGFSDDIIQAQKNVIERLIAPYYDGPMGIDMLADIEGRINPCVEINLRMTMGMATILGIRNEE